MIRLKENLKDVSYNLKTKDISAKNEVSDKLKQLKQRNTILKRKQTFRSIKDIETEKMISDIEDKLEFRSRDTISISKKQVTIESQISIDSPKFTENSESKIKLLPYFLNKYSN